MIWTIFTIWEVLKRNTHQHAREDHLAMKMSNNYYLPPDTIFSLCFMSSSQTFSQSYATITCKPVGIDGCYCMELRCNHYWKQNGGFLQFLFLKNSKFKIWNFFSYVVTLNVNILYWQHWCARTYIQWGTLTWKMTTQYNMVEIQSRIHL